ncbi:MAG: hypothetical protein ACLFQV_03185 [Vulcanimicrobiota bacterium]
MKNSNRTSKGFSFAELLLAMVYTTVVILSCYAAVTQAYFFVRYTEGDLTATHLANQQMAYFRSSFARVPDISPPATQVALPEELADLKDCYTNTHTNNIFETKTLNGQDYDIFVRVKPVPGYETKTDNIVHVNVIVVRKVQSKVRDKTEYRRTSIESIFYEEEE